MVRRTGHVVSPVIFALLTFCLGRAKRWNLINIRTTEQILQTIERIFFFLVIVKWVLTLVARWFLLDFQCMGCPPRAPLPCHRSNFDCDAKRKNKAGCMRAHTNFGEIWFQS
ncbi:unnamed protein product, partial [Ectocarpus sp. 12 AP-2014]